MRDLRQGKKLVNDQSLQRCTIRHRDVDEVVLITADVVERKSLRQREGFVHEVVGGISCVRADLDTEKRLLALAKQAREHMGASRDDGAMATHPPDPLQTRARSHAHLGRDVLVRHGRIDLH